jgi:hypothetical protein
MKNNSISEIQKSDLIFGCVREGIIIVSKILQNNGLNIIDEQLAFLLDLSLSFDKSSI